MRLPYRDNELVRLSYQAPPSLAEANDPALRLAADGNPALARIGTDRAVKLQAIPGIGKARHLIQEFTFKAEYAYDVGCRSGSPASIMRWRHYTWRTSFWVATNFITSQSITGTNSPAM
jgi:hypothetical protein